MEILSRQEILDLIPTREDFSKKDACQYIGHQVQNEIIRRLRDSDFLDKYRDELILDGLLNQGWSIQPNSFLLECSDDYIFWHKNACDNCGRCGTAKSIAEAVQRIQSIIKVRGD